MTKFFSTCVAGILLSFGAQAAVNAGLPDPASGPGASITSLTQNTYTRDMRAVDRLLQKQEYARAIPHLERIVRDPDVAGQDRSAAYNLKGLSLYMVGRIAEAIDDFTMSLDIQARETVSYTQRWKTLFNRGLAYEAVKDLSRAADDYVCAYAIAPDERRVKSKIYNFFNKE